MIRLLLTIFFLVVAAYLEVRGDAFIRDGLQDKSFVGIDWRLVVVGFILLGFYGIAVNSVSSIFKFVNWNFSELLGIYIFFFALITVLFSKYKLKEDIAWSTWVGIGIIALGGLVIQYGQRIFAWYQSN